jgi:hypothetical protein
MHQAISKYEKALLYLDQGGFAGEEKVQAATISCNLNAAQCFLKLGKSACKSVAACT